jgi:hypothetical protein
MLARSGGVFLFITTVGTAVFQATLPSAAQQPPAAGQQPPAGQPPPAGRGTGQRPAGPLVGRRVSPPQPQQKQGADYFAGSWTFTWTGRESPVTPGPRGGTVTFARGSAPNHLDLRVEGKVEEGPDFKESGTLDWDEAKKAIVLKERLSNGTEIQGTGDWASPLGIKYESQPVKVGNQTIKLRRTYAILSAASFTVAEEISIDGGPFQRLGNGSFSKAQ